MITSLQRQKSTLRTEVADAHKMIACLQREKAELQSSLAITEVNLVEANQRISKAETALEEARKEAQNLKSDNTNREFLLAAAKANKGETPGIETFLQWMHEHSIDAETPLFVGSSSSSSSDSYNVLIQNALLLIRSQNYNTAYEDARQSIKIRPSTMGYIVGALARIGKGDPEEALQTFDLAFGNSDPNENNLLLLIKATMVFIAKKYDEAISRMNDLISLSRDETVYTYYRVLGKMYLVKGEYEQGAQMLTLAEPSTPSCTGHDLEAISTIFGWSFDGLRITGRLYHCEALVASCHAEEAAEALLDIRETFDEDIHASEATEMWVADLQKKCTDVLKARGDAALDSGKHGVAISQYSSALSLSPSNPVDILVKRSEARALEGLWKDALQDANEVIKLDPSSRRGYERKHAALHGAEDYDEAINAVIQMLSKVDNSQDEETCRLKENYTSPRETIAAIDRAIHDIFKLCPLVLVDVTTGRLCDAQERVQLFKSETPFKKIVSEAAVTKLDDGRILQAVAKYFEWIMLSHVWEGDEPTFHDVNRVDSVWKLDVELVLNEKLRQFCTTAREDGYRWAWSDTCCINKDTEAVLNRSLTSMYSWYEEATATLVYLADVAPLSELGDLTKSRWMTRAWTLQELLASRVVRFYDSTWKPYLRDMQTNHKESPLIKEELARAMCVSHETIASFQPEDLGVREKLRLASTRNATVEEDIAYSLIGIFSSDIAPRYGLGKIALGQLLENIVARSGDVTVIAWTGKSSSYNSALPTTLAVYSQNPYSPPPLDLAVLDTQVEQLRDELPQEDALTLYYRLIQLPRATFSNRCLQLPCIMFSVTKIVVQESGDKYGNLYRALVPSLGKVVFRTEDAIPVTKPKNLVFVHPWIRDLRGTFEGFASDDEPEVSSDAGSDGKSETVSIAGTGDGINSALAPTSLSHAQPSARAGPYTEALRLIARLRRPFNVLLLQRQPNGQYKRVAAEYEIIIPGAPDVFNLKDIRTRVLEIV